MANIKNIWNKSFLGKLLSTDPIMGRTVLCILMVYVLIHLFRLEMYPLYMFAMYSKKETPKETYDVYKLYELDKEITLRHWDFRKYTVLMNTIRQYDGILNNDYCHPEAQAIDKMMEKLRLRNSGIERKLKQHFYFSKDDFKENFGIWISNQLKIKPHDLSIEKVSYNWEKDYPIQVNKVSVYEMD